MPTFAELLHAHCPTDVERMATLRAGLPAYAHLIRGKRVLDFGASYGVSAVVLAEMGAESVVGIEPDKDRVDLGVKWLADTGLDERINLSYTPDTLALPLENESFDTVIANAVLEHIPQPRAPYLREMWRVLKRGGHLVINETPNKYLPFDFHTLHLPLTNWLPSGIAHAIGVRLGRFDPNRTDWAHSGWRGLGYYEMMRGIPGDCTVTHEIANRRHRILRALGLPSGLLDPYPFYVIQKN